MNIHITWLRKIQWEHVPDHRCGNIIPHNYLHQNATSKQCLCTNHLLYRILRCTICLLGRFKKLLGTIFVMYLEFHQNHLQTFLISNHNAGSEVIKCFSCSSQLSMKFSLLINMKMPTIVGIFIFISREIFMLIYV